MDWLKGKTAGFFDNSQGWKKHYFTQRLCFMSNPSNLFYRFMPPRIFLDWPCNVLVPNNNVLGPNNSNHENHWTIPTVFWESCDENLMKILSGCPFRVGSSDLQVCWVEHPNAQAPWAPCERNVAGSSLHGSVYRGSIPGFDDDGVTGGCGSILIYIYITIYILYYICIICIR